LESRGEKGVESVRLRIVEGYVFYPSTREKWSNALENFEENMKPQTLDREALSCEGES
jgi:hypothetical protein